MSRQRALSVAVPVALMASQATAQCEPVWSSLGGLDGWGNEAFAAYDEDGHGSMSQALFTGPALGDISSVTRWDGWHASAVGSQPPDRIVRHLEVVPTGGVVAPGLYAGGTFDHAGGMVANNLARWDGSAWHDVGGGLTAAALVLVNAMVTFDEDGEGSLPPLLFVGGRFQFAGGVNVAAIARWDGAQWSGVGGSLATAVAGAYPKVNAMTVYDDGRGPALYVGGSFTFAGGEPLLNIARWDGQEWETLGPGFNGAVHTLCVFDEDGPGGRPPALFAGGAFSSLGGSEPGSMRGISRWDGAEWTAVGETLNVGSIRALATWDEDGAGPAKPSLYVGGTINQVIGSIPVNNLVRWDGEQWHDVGGGVTGFGAGTSVSALSAFDEDGPGPNPGGLYVGGLFYRAGSVETKHVARWGCPLSATPPCYPDCDGSGELTFFDFLCFQNLFAAGDPGADCDGDTQHTFFDFLCFQNAFAAGCR